MFNQDKFNEVFGKPAQKTKAETLAHYTKQAEAAKALHQFETLVKVWEASRKTSPGFTAGNTIKAVESTRSTPLLKKAVEDFSYHAHIITWAEKQA